MTTGQAWTFLWDVAMEYGLDEDDSPATSAWPLLNVWLGVSVENQEAADERIPELLRTPAVVRFLSCEPLLGPVDLRQWMTWSFECARCGPGVLSFDDSGVCNNCNGPVRENNGPDWVIVGCESGPRARECKVEWLRSLRDQCAAADVPFFLKQAVELRDGGNESGDSHRIAMHRGSKRKAGNVIELPALDGEQHAAFPEVKP